MDARSGGGSAPLLLRGAAHNLLQREKTLIRWGTLTLALSRARKRARVRGSIVQLSAIDIRRSIKQRLKHSSRTAALRYPRSTYCFW